MALHTNLPIYKVSYDLLDVITDLAKNMPRDFKASIGGKLRDECVEIVVLIFRANVAREKAPHLGTLIERLQVAELLLRLSCDGTKDTEYRLYGPRWNERTCSIGRPAVISKGYGIRHRRTTKVTRR
jgi:hypothetical protein